MKNVYGKISLMFSAALIAVCCAFAAVFAFADLGQIAHADIDDVTETVYWGVGYDGDDGMLLIHDGSAYEESEFTYSGSFAGTDVFTSAPWKQYKDIVESVFVDYVVTLSTANWFDGFSNLISVDLTGLDSANVTDTSNMFSGCSSLTSLDLSYMDTSMVTDADNMLAGLDALESLSLSDELAATMAEIDVGLNATLYVDCEEFYAPSGGLYEGLSVGDYYTSAPHNMSFVDAVAATCSEEGNIAHYICSFCDKTFEDEEGKTELAEVATEIDPDNHDWVHRDGKEPTSSESGYTDYEECSLCGETRGKTDIPATGSGSGGNEGEGGETGGNEGSGSGSSGSGSSSSSVKKKSMSNKTLLILLCVGVGLVTLMAILALVLAIKKRRGENGGKDDDGFYDDYIGEY